ncbi:hypothetical protein BGX23_006335 [Mortierella sp. AD031]|nr:hypothetical protein BGX23_006335 [Mortierella sp. AD031]
MNSNTASGKSTSDLLRRQNALRMLDTILSSALSSSSPPPPPSQPTRRQKQPSPPSSQDTLAFAPHLVADRGYQPDTDDLGSNDDNSDSHDDLFSARDLSALLIQQDLQRQQAARKLQSHQLKQRQLLMQQHQRIFQDSQQIHTTPDRHPQRSVSSHIPGKAHEHNHAHEEEHDDDGDDNDDEEEEEEEEEEEKEDHDRLRTASRQNVDTFPHEQQYQYTNTKANTNTDININTNSTRYQESDDDHTTSAPAPPSSDKKPKGRGRPKGSTTDTTPSKTASSSSRALDKPKRQYKKTILRQQAALLAAQIKDENEARDTEATRRVLARTGVIKHLRSLKHRLNLAQYKVDKGLQEQPLHMVVELFEDSLEDDYYSDDEREDSHAVDNLTSQLHPPATLSTATPQPDPSRGSSTTRRTKLSPQAGPDQRNVVANGGVGTVGSWAGLNAVDSVNADSEDTDSDEGFPDTPTKPRGRFAIPRSSAELNTRTSLLQSDPSRRVQQPVRPLAGNPAPTQRLASTLTTTSTLYQPTIASSGEYSASDSDHSDSEGTDEPDSTLAQPIASTLPITPEALQRQQALQLVELQRLQRKQILALQEEQQKALRRAHNQWLLHQSSTSRVASTPKPATTPPPKSAVSTHRRRISPMADSENHNPFQEAASDKEQRLRRERLMAPLLPRQANVLPAAKASAAKPPLPEGVHQRGVLQTPTRSMTPDRAPTASPHLASAISAKTVERVTQDSFVTPQRRPVKSLSPALQRRRTVELASDTESPQRVMPPSPLTSRQLEERERQKERIRENQLREQELIRKQRQLEHQQLQQSRRKQLLLQLQYQHLQEQERLQSSEPRNQKSRPEPLKPAESKVEDGPSRLLFSPPNSSATPKKKKPLNPVQKAPSTENILASVRSSQQSGIRSTIIAASSALASAKTVLLGNKRVLSTTEDKENIASPPQSPLARVQPIGGSQSPVAGRQLLEKTYKRQRPANFSATSSAPPLRPAPASPVQWMMSSNKPQPVNPVRKNSMHSRKSSKEGSLSYPSTAPGPSPSSAQTQVSLSTQEADATQTSKDFLNCFDQWMSDLGSEEVEGLPLSETPIAVLDTTSDPVVSPFMMDQSHQKRSLNDAFTNGLPGQDDGTGTEQDESEIDQLLYSDFGDDYAAYGGGGSIGTPASEAGQVDLTTDFMKTDFYDWFPESFRDQATAGPVATPPTPSEHHLSLLSTDPILSSSPAELSQGLELDPEFDAAALPWSQQRALQSPQQLQHPQLHHHQKQEQQLQESPPNRDLSSSRAGTPQLDSSASLLSSSFTEILSPVVDMAPSSHYVPMGLEGQAATTEVDLLGKDHSLAASQAVDLAYFLH